jgi:hypothetical protein
MESMGIEGVDHLLLKVVQNEIHRTFGRVLHLHKVSHEVHWISGASL